jgi:hypothetical protein
VDDCCGAHLASARDLLVCTFVAGFTRDAGVSGNPGRAGPSDGGGFAARPQCCGCTFAGTFGARGSVPDE